jgi:protein-tyrosine-phosphatase
MAEGILRTPFPRALPRGDRLGRNRGLTGRPREHSVTVCQEEGIDISRHRSRSLTRLLVEESDLVLAMEEHHAETARRLAPDHGDRIHLLQRYAANGHPAVRGGVPDPMGGDLEDYRMTFVEIHEQITAALPRLEGEIAEAPVEP